MNEPAQAAAAITYLARALERARAGETAALLEVAGADPVSMLHALTLVAGGEGPRLAQLYSEVVDLCAASGVHLLREESAPVARLFLARLLGESEEEAVAPLVRFSAPSFALKALEVTRLGLVCCEIDAPVARALSRAAMLAAVRRRDYADLGLYLLGHTLCFSDDDLPHVYEWLRRVRRSDGFYGVWDLFEDGCSTANLAASVNVDWGLSVRREASAPCRLGDALALRIDPEISISSKEVDRAIRGLQSWVEARVDQFTASRFSSQQDYGGAVKRVVELVLALWLIWRSGGPQAPWARQLAEQIRPIVGGEGFVEALRVFPTTILAALMYPMLADLCGARGPFDEEVARLARDGFSKGQERIPMRQMDYHFLLRVLEGGDGAAPFAAIDALLPRTLLASCPNPCLLGNDALYDITHAIFYGTDFGTRLLPADDATLSWCARWIPELCLSFLLEGDLDIGGELLLNWMHLRLPAGEMFQLCVRRLLAGLREDGAAPGPARADNTGCTDFELTYHTTLIALITLVEFRHGHRHA